MGLRFFFPIFTFFITVGLTPSASARRFDYPQVKYVSSVSEGMAGVVLPLSEEAGNALMNNPAALARYSGYRAEPLNMNFVANSNLLYHLDESLGRSFSLGGLSSYLNSNPNQQFGLGFSNMTAFSWQGFAFGVLLQEYSNATSDGTNVKYQTVSQLVPTIGYGFGLARNLIRVGYSLQYVNQTSGSATSVSDTGASFLNGLQKGSGLSHNVSVNLVLPFTYLPTFSVMARNLGGLHFASTSLLPRGTGVTGVPEEEKMSVDAAFDFIVKITGTFKTHVYLEYKDLTRRSTIPNLYERLSTAVDFSIGKRLGVRGGMTGIADFSAGISYRGDSSEIALAYYHEKSPFDSTRAWDLRYGLQYKLMLYEKAKKVDGDLQQVGSRR